MSGRPGPTPEGREAVVVGAGPAGLACALELRRLGVADVLVLEREEQAGGIPRHCAHQGFGARDLRRALPGPRYAGHYARAALDAGATIERETMVTGWSAEGELQLTGPGGRRSVAAAAVVLATGCRERPRSARLVAGSRPRGVMNTGTLQQLVHLHGRRLRGRALIVGAEHVSFSALLTLRRAGAEVVAIVTELPRQQSLPLAGLAARARFGVPVWTGTAVRAIEGRDTVEGVRLERLDTHATRTLECELVVFSAGWIPDHELAVLGGLELDPATRGPRVDPALRSTRAGVFAAGNLVQGAEPADVAALGGRHVARTVARWLSGPREWPAPGPPIVTRPPLGWISPNGLGSGRDAPLRGRLQLRSESFLRRPLVEVRQGRRLLWRGHVAHLQPGRSRRLDARWLAAADPGGEEIEVSIAGS